MSEAIGSIAVSPQAVSFSQRKVHHRAEGRHRGRMLPSVKMFHPSPRVSSERSSLGASASVAYNKPISRAALLGKSFFALITMLHTINSALRQSPGPREMALMIPTVAKLRKIF